MCHAEGAGALTDMEKTVGRSYIICTESTEYSQRKCDRIYQTAYDFLAVSQIDFYLHDFIPFLPLLRKKYLLHLWIEISISSTLDSYLAFPTPCS